METIHGESLALEEPFESPDVILISHDTFQPMHEVRRLSLSESHLVQKSCMPGSVLFNVDGMLWTHAPDTDVQVYGVNEERRHSSRILSWPFAFIAILLFFGVMFGCWRFYLAGIVHMEQDEERARMQRAWAQNTASAPRVPVYNVPRSIKQQIQVSIPKVSSASSHTELLFLLFVIFSCFCSWHAPAFRGKWLPR